MATRKPKQVNAAYTKKAPSEVHQAFAEYIFRTTGVEVSNEIVALVQRLYPLYLKTPDVVKAREAAKAARAKEKAAKDAEKTEKLQAKLARLEEQRQKLLASLGMDDAPAPLHAVPEVAEDEEDPVEVTLEEPEEDDEDEAEDDLDDWGDEEEEEEDF